MLYLTGQHALNLPCSLDTCGDWHTSALNWTNIPLADSDKMLFKEYGIEEHSKIPGHHGKFFVANHIRALLDLLEFGNFAVAQGMRNDYICNPKYTAEIFNKVWQMKILKNWTDIDTFMSKEYLMQWVNYKKGRVSEHDRRPERTLI